MVPTSCLGHGMRFICRPIESTKCVSFSAGNRTNELSKVDGQYTKFVRGDDVCSKVFVTGDGTGIRTDV